MLFIDYYIYPPEVNLSQKLANVIQQRVKFLMQCVKSYIKFFSKI